MLEWGLVNGNGGIIHCMDSIFTIFDHKNANLFPSAQRNNTLYIRLARGTWKFVRAVFR